MVLSDIARCEGSKRIDGTPHDVCRLCERRSYAPSNPLTTWIAPARTVIDGEPDCPNRRVSGEQEAE